MASLKQKMEQAGLFGLSRLDAAAFCLACAERVRPIVSQLASDDTIALYDDALEAGWATLPSSGESTRIKKLLTEIRGSRDVTSEPARRTFYVKAPLATLHHALLALSSGSATKEAQNAWCLTVGLARDCDYHLRKYCKEPSTYPLQELTCEDLENDGIEETLRILAECAGNSEKVRKQLRPESVTRAHHLLAAVARIDEAGGFGSK